MSYQAVYEVTRALRMLLRSQLVARSAGAVVTLLPPGDTLPEVSGVNLYLYRVVESPFTRNEPWRGDRSRPPSNQPALGLQLFYLLTPLGVKPADGSFDQGDDAHTMLGAAMLTLQEHPVLNDAHLAGFDADLVLSASLRDSYEQIKVTLLQLSLDELTKIWSAINKPYRLSVAYEVSLVELTPTPPPPVNGGIVITTSVDVITLDPPRLVELIPAGGALAHIDGGGAVTPNDLQVRGFGLLLPGQPSIVRVGGQPVTVRSVPAPTDRALTVEMPAEIDAGPQVDVRVTRTGRTSAPLAFTVTPWLSFIQPVRAAPAPVASPPLSPPAAALKLTLTGAGLTNPGAVRFDGQAGTTEVTTFDAGGSDTRATVTIPATLANGLYEVRVVLNDAPRSATNPRTLEVTPLLDSVAIVSVALSPPTAGPAHRLTLTGARLNGADVRLLIDGVVYQAGANANAAQLVYRLGRELSPGAHQIAVNVDGHTSRTVTEEV